MLKTSLLFSTHFFSFHFMHDTKYLRKQKEDTLLLKGNAMAIQAEKIYWRPTPPYRKNTIQKLPPFVLQYYPDGARHTIKNIGKYLLFTVR